MFLISDYFPEERKTFKKKTPLKNWEETETKVSVLEFQASCKHHSADIVWATRQSIQSANIFNCNAFTHDKFLDFLSTRHYQWQYFTFSSCSLKAFVSCNYAKARQEDSMSCGKEEASSRAWMRKHSDIHAQQSHSRS